MIDLGPAAGCLICICFHGWPFLIKVHSECVFVSTTQFGPATIFNVLMFFNVWKVVYISLTFHYIIANVLPVPSSFLKALQLTIAAIKSWDTLFMWCSVISQSRTSSEKWWLSLCISDLLMATYGEWTTPISHVILLSFPFPPLDGSTNLFPNTCWAANSFLFFLMKGSVSAQSNSINRRVKPGPPHCSMNEKQFCQFNDYQQKHTQTFGLFRSHSSSSMPRASAPCSPYRH